MAGPTSLTRAPFRRPGLGLYDMAEKIAAVDATHVEVIAKKVTITLMERLGIDVVGGIAYPDQQRWVIISGKYDPSSKFLEAVLPQIVKQIRGAFSAPMHFISKGAHLKIFTRDKRGGLFDRVKEEAFFEQGARAKKRLIDNFGLQRPLLEYRLELNKEKTSKISELVFDLMVYINGACMGREEGTIQDFKDSSLLLQKG